jgi:H+-translocating NAD(P) transhydrogenase subunit alpha
MPNLSSLSEALTKAQDALNEAVQQQSALESQLHGTNTIDPTIMLLTVFVLACFVGYYVVWKVTPALHTPLMSVTNAISGIIVVGAIIAVGPADGSALTRSIGFIAVIISSINIFGGFVVTQRMLDMYRKKDSK